MVKIGKFGIMERFMIFDEKEFRINNKDSFVFRKNLESLILEDDYVTFIRLIEELHDKRESEYKLFNPTIEFISKYIDMDCDDLYLLQFCEPERHNPNDRFGRYPNSKVAKRSNQLEYKILRELSEKWRVIAELSMKGDKGNLPKTSKLRSRLWFWLK